METITQGQAVWLRGGASVKVLVKSDLLADATTQYKVIESGIGGVSGPTNQGDSTSDPALALGANDSSGRRRGTRADSGQHNYHILRDLTVGKYVALLGVGIGGNKINLKVTRAGGRTEVT